MNALNSILLEGSLVADPIELTYPEGTIACYFNLSSDRFFKIPGSGALEKQTGIFKIIAWSRLAVSCLETLKEGRGVRVVGRLVHDPGDSPSVYIVAEHVEFKPVTKEDPA